MLSLILIVVLFALFLVVMCLAMQHEHKDMQELLDKIRNSEAKLTNYNENDEYDFGHNVNLTEIDDVEFEEEDEEEIDELLEEINW